MQEILGKVANLKYLTQDTLELRVQLLVPEAIGFAAGQYLEIKAGQKFLPYYIANVPAERNSLLVFCVRVAADTETGIFFKNLKPEEELVVSEPAGDFVAHNLERSRVFAALGTGVAVFSSIIGDLLARQSQAEMHLVFGVESEEDVFYYDHFQNLASQHPNFTFTPLVRQPKSHWPGEVGTVATHLAIEYPRYKSFEFWICAQKSEADKLKELLLKFEHNPGDIKIATF